MRRLIDQTIEYIKQHLEEKEMLEPNPEIPIRSDYELLLEKITNAKKIENPPELLVREIKRWEAQLKEMEEI